MVRTESQLLDDRSRGEIDLAPGEVKPLPLDFSKR
jgi:hypothetical protein